MRQKIGHKISRLGNIIQRPYLLPAYFQRLDIHMFEALNKPWLLRSDIRTVLDIGANTGQFARIIHRLLPEVFIYSFEPLPDCFKELQMVMRKVKNFQGFNIALDDKEDETTIFRSDWSPSSSLRPMASLHKECFPYTASESREIVRSRRLDDCSEELNIQDNLLIKVDVQGYEDKVIFGGERIFQRAKVLLVETSMETLYEGQPLFRDIFMLLNDIGFIYKGALNQRDHPFDKSVLYSDSIFIRKM